jgi:hypothetical protein
MNVELSFGSPQGRFTTESGEQGELTSGWANERTNCIISLKYYRRWANHS